MKRKIILCALLLPVAIGLWAQGRLPKVTVQMTDVKMSAVMEEIERQTRFLFGAGEGVDVNALVTVRVQDRPLTAALDQLVAGKDVEYAINGYTIVLKPKTPARNITVRGEVRDEDGKPVPGAGVVCQVKGRAPSGTLTDMDGRYEITVPENAVLEFSFIGYTPVTEKVGGRTRIDVRLYPDANELEAVVVTALGLTREEKSLGYAVSKVEGESVTQTVSSNWLNAMSGKVAGLNFDYASAGPGGSVRATLRGEASLSYDNNNALFVVDGVPIYTSMAESNSGSTAFNVDAPIDYGNGASDINPEDIESISVLKGPSATALYGSRAANGAIIITTKGGRKEKGLGITYSGSVTFEQAGYWPDFQTGYGAGNGNASNLDQQQYYNYWSVQAAYAADGVASSGRVYSRVAFGAKFDGQEFYQYASRDWDTGIYTKLPWVYRDWYKGFFETGLTQNHSVLISGNTGKGTSVRFSIKDSRNDWIVPNTGYVSDSFSASVNQKVNDIISVDVKVNYYKKDSDNLPMSGYNAASPLYTLIWNPNVVDVRSYWDEYSNGRIAEMYKAGTPTLLINSTYADNIYMQVYEQLNTMDRDRVYGNAAVNFNLWKEKLTLRIKSGIDLNSEFRTQRKPWYSNSYQYGYYKEQTVRNFEMNNEFLFTFKDQWKDWSLSASFGGNDYLRNYSAVTLSTPDGLLSNSFILANSRQQLNTDAYRSAKRIMSLFGLATLGWRNRVFLDVTGRNDWSSTLPLDHNSYFYPSVSASLMVNELLRFSERLPWWNMLKLRASWANVGNDTSAYQIAQVYTNSDFAGTFRLNPSLKNADLKPENMRSYEVGIEAKFLKNRLGFDFAYYDNLNTNQIIDVPVDYITGASSMKINAGAVSNKGVEISLTAVPVKTRDWEWRVSGNWSRNKNLLVELADGVDLWQMNSSLTVGGNVYIYAMPGTELGRLYGRGFERAPEGAFYLDEAGNKVDCSGQVVVSKSNGNPVLTSADNVLENDFGSIYPDWNGGFGTSLRWKDLSMNATFSYQKGGNTYSMTHFALAYQGKLTNSLEGRYEGLVHPGVNLNEDGTYSRNTTITTDIVDYYNTYVYARENAESNIFDTSFLKMKELRIDWTLPRRLCAKTRVLQGASIGVYGTNLFCLTTFPIYDPEAGALVGNSIRRGIEAGAYPMTRTFGMNLKLQF